MSDSEATPTIRRSGRDRKRARPFVQDPSAASRKRKRDTDDEGGNTTDKHTSDGGELDEEHEGDLGDADDDEAEEFLAPKPKLTRQKKQNTPFVAPKTKGKAPTTKKSRAAKTKTSTSTRKGKVDASVDVIKQLKDTHISDDNALFNAILNPSAALQSTVEDYLDSLSQAPNLALADLINCVIRACGCNDSVDADQAVDSDGVLDVLDTFTDNLKSENTPPYPLISKLPVFKKFHKQLSEFIHRLITSSAEMGSLYTSDLMPTMQSWVVAMSSSQLRSLRHTATVIAMEVESALCEVAAEIEKEVVVIARQREGEKKRAGKSKGKGLEKEFEGKAAEVRERKNQMGEFLREFFDGVFVHRYRDHDPGIRAECVQAMGVWLKRHPTQFLEGSYLRYVGWVLSDSDTHVRLEAVKSLHSLYAKSDYLTVLQTFTDRFKGRLVEMATSDLELPVRVAVIQVLVAIDSHSLLDEEQRDELSLLIYDEEPRVRKAVAGFVRGVWEEAVEERMIGHKHERDKDKVGIKCLATLLVQWSRRTRPDHEHDDDCDDKESPVEESNNKDIARLVSAQHTGRIALAVEALWDEVDAIGDWEALLEHLLLDHSASAEDVLNGIGPSPVARRRRQNAAAKKKVAEEEAVDEAWRLTEAEETALLEVFVAALRMAKDEASGGKKGGEETLLSDITRALMKGLPRLFAKYQTDSNRVADVLVIPQLMNVDMYLEMRMIPAYEGLWGDVTKQFLSHSSPVVLGHAMTTIQHFMSATLLSNTNSAKIIELEEELSTTLRDAVAGREELEVASFSEDEVHALGAIASRLVVLATARDMTSWMEEDEGGKQSSAWDIISALADRGRLGYKEEEAMIDECLRLLTIHLAWKARGLSLDVEPNEEEVRYRDALKDQRDSLLEKVTEYAVGTQSSACESVKRAAFHNLLDLHILFSDCQSIRPDGTRLPPAAMPLTMSDETQYRCAGFVQAEIEQYVDDLDEDTGGEKGATTDENSSQPGSAGEENEVLEKNAKPKKSKGRRRRREDSPDPHTLPRSRLEREYTLNALLASFIRSIRVGTINPMHSALILAHYDRLGSGFDTSIRVVVDFLRDLGMFKAQGQTVSEIIVKALQEAFTLFLGGLVNVDDHAVALARTLSSCFVVRGAQLSVIKRLENDHIVEVHTSSISWIVKTIATYESAKDLKLRTKAVQFFRALQQLLVMVESRDALKIKAHLHQAVAQTKVDVNTSKTWDPYRAYEKRLSTAMSKDKNLPSSGKGTRGRKRKKAAKSADEIHSDDDAAEVEGLISGSGTEGDEPAPPPRPKPRPKPRQALHRTAEGDERNAEDVFGPVSSPQVSSPPSRRPSRTQNNAAASNDESEALEGDEGGSSPIRGQVVANGFKSPPLTSSKKRRREDSGPIDEEAQENDDPSRSNRAPSPSQSHISIADIKNRRKRVRR